MLIFKIERGKTRGRNIAASSLLSSTLPPPLFSFSQSMAANAPHALFIVATIFTLLSSSLTLSTAEETAYDILPKYGLPSGLLPDTVTGYTLSDDGRFVVNLAKTCYIKFDYMVYYEKTITGKLSYGAITDLKGIQVQRLLIWFNVDEIRVDLPPSDSIYFQVGIINKRLDIDQFKSVRSCRKSLASSSPCHGNPITSSVVF